MGSCVCGPVVSGPTGGIVGRAHIELRSGLEFGTGI